MKGTHFEGTSTKKKRLHFSYFSLNNVKNWVHVEKKKTGRCVGQDSESVRTAHARCGERADDLAERSTGKRERNKMKMC